MVTQKTKKIGLPKGWIDTTLGSIIELKYGKALRKSDRDNTGKVPVYGSSGIVGFHTKSLNNQPGLIVGRKGSVGSVYLSACPFWAIDTTYFIEKNDAFDLNYLYYLLSSLGLVRLDKSTAIPGLSRDDAYKQRILLAPLNEQKRIVAKIEQLFSDLDAGVETLRALKKQIRQYRQSVLKSAFEGKLTAEWRKANKDKIQPASALLEKIAKEKAQKTRGKKQKKLPPLDTTNLPELPEGWEWAGVGSLAESMKNGIYKPKQFYSDNGIACLRMYNIKDGCIVWKDVKRMILTEKEMEEYALLPNDLLVNRVNSRELVGKTAVIPNHLEPCVYESKNIRLRLIDATIKPKFVNFWFLFYAHHYFNMNAQQVVGMASINQTQLSLMPIPLASLSEQNQIVSQIERHFSIADQVEEVVDTALKQSGRLRQSILKRAFEGKLVPQDPNDEPAEKLLERIAKNEVPQKPRR